MSVGGGPSQLASQVGHYGSGSPPGFLGRWRDDALRVHLQNTQVATVSEVRCDGGQLGEAPGLEQCQVRQHTHPLWDLGESSVPADVDSAERVDAGVEVEPCELEDTLRSREVSLLALVHRQAVCRNEGILPRSTPSQNGVGFILEAVMREIEVSQHRTVPLGDGWDRLNAVVRSIQPTECRELE